MFEDYNLALVALALMALLCVVLGPVSAVTKTKAGLPSGASPEPDYNNIAYRAHRAHGNAVETLPVFAAVLFVAIAAGASPFWINLFASLFILARLAMVAFHIKGVGKADGGPRSMAFGLGWMMTILIGVFGVLAALF